MAIRRQRKVVMLATMLSSLLPAAHAFATTVSGRVHDLDGNDHVVIKMVGSKTYRATTRTGGAWVLEDVAEGDYTVTPIHARYSFTPAQRTLVVGDKTTSDVDFQASPRKDEKTHTGLDREPGKTARQPLPTGGLQ